MNCRKDCLPRWPVGIGVLVERGRERKGRGERTDETDELRNYDTDWIAQSCWIETRWIRFGSSSNHNTLDACEKKSNSYQLPVPQPLQTPTQLTSQFHNPLSLTPSNPITISNNRNTLLFPHFYNLFQSIQHCRFGRSHFLSSTVDCEG